MSIKQLNATYDALEDRILFRVTSTLGQEYRLWLTRAVTGQIIALAQVGEVKVLEQQHPQEQAAAIASFKQQALEETTQFTDEFESAPELPMGQAPVLVAGFNLTLKGREAATALVLANHQTLTLNIDAEMLSKFKLLLQRIAAHANWGAMPQQAPLAADQDPQAGTASTKLLH